MNNRDLFLFLLDVIKSIAILNDADRSHHKEVIFPLLASNTDKLVPALGKIIQWWSLETFTHGTPDRVRRIAGCCHTLGNLLHEFPLGNPRSNKQNAIACYSATLHVFTESELPRSWSAAQNDLGSAYINLAPFSENPKQEIENAIACYRSALRVDTKEERPQEWAEIQNNLGVAYSDLAAFSDSPKQAIELAISHYQASLQIRTKAAMPQTWAKTQNNLATAYSELRPFSENPKQEIENSIACYLSTLQVSTEAAMPQAWALIQNNLGLAYITLAPFSENPKQEIENSIAYYRAALRIRTEEKLPQDWAETQISLGNTLSLSELFSENPKQEIENAIVCYRAALKVCKEVEEAPWGKIQINLGNVYRKLASYSENPKQEIENAIACYHAALRVITEEERTEFFAKIHNNLGIAYKDLASYSENPKQEIENAISCLRIALRVRTEEERPQDWAATQYYLGNVYMKLALFSENPAQEIEKAIACYYYALKIRTKVKTPQVWADTQINLGAAYAFLTEYSGNPMHELEQAINCYRSALEVCLPETRSVNCLQIGKNLGNLGFAKNFPDIAIEGYTIAIAAVENLRSEAIDPNRREEILSNAIEVYANLIQVYVDRGEYDKAIEICDRSKARNLVELLTTRDLYPQCDIPPEILAELDRLRGAIATAERQLNQSVSDSQQFLSDTDGDIRSVDARSLRAQADTAARDRLVRLKQELDTLIQTEIQHQDPAFSLTQKVQPLTFDQLRDTIPSDKTVILSWYIAGNKLIAFLISRNSDQPTLFPYPYDALEQLIALLDDYIDNYRDQKQAWRDRLPDLLQQLSNILQIDRLLEAIFQLQSNCDRLILIPHRFLHILPLHALPLASQGNYLLDAFPNGIRFAPSLQVLGLAQQRQKTDLDNLLAIQNPTEDLPFTDFEVSILRRFFTPNDAVLIHTAATTEALRNSQIERSHCLHFACHGYFNFAQPERSALLLAGSQTDNNDESKCLTLLDLFQLKLQKCGLVVLSACETGLTNFNSQSDEFVGLPSGFLFAGSPSVISSLWTVDDLATSLLMVSFYRHLKAEQMPPALALKQAQNDLRLTKVELVALADRLNLDGEARTRFDSAIRKFSDDDRPYASPFYWAAFQAIGQ
ncbi:CHAT domain-containing protein [Tumidithrix elongata RA019]|uniref:CHAT domain-containing protein n=1 Tax=Tumidithrix elongata BACA0141 TaxID=2716417 RepID=A0AAW9PVC5_9CYAN|nr:CHAT domain-containing protein [Tumidithrix elongata RA019]